MSGGASDRRGIPISQGNRRPTRALLGIASAIVIVVFAASVLLDRPTLDALESPQVLATLIRAQATDVFAALSRLPPLVFFGAMAILCVLPVPVSAFYVSGAAIYGAETALAWIAGALVVNIWLAQTIASRWLRPFATRMLEARDIAIPRAADGHDEVWLIALVRIAPGLPFFAQNLVLGLANVNRAKAIAISLPIQMSFAGGFVVFGRSAFEGRLGTAVAAIGLIASVSIVARFVHRKLAVGRQDSK